jgi:hypothetical protein
MKAAKEISKYKLDLVGVHEARWDRGGTDPGGKYTFFNGKGYDIRYRFSVHKRIISAVKRVEFLNAKISYIIIRGTTRESQ